MTARCRRPGLIGAEIELRVPLLARGGDGAVPLRVPAAVGDVRIRARARARCPGARTGVEKLAEAADRDFELIETKAGNRAFVRVGRIEHAAGCGVVRVATDDERAARHER